jgi:hypothetical protein
MQRLPCIAMGIMGILFVNLLELRLIIFIAEGQLCCDLCTCRQSENGGTTGIRFLRLEDVPQGIDPLPRRIRSWESCRSNQRVKGG